MNRTLGTTRLWASLTGLSGLATLAVTVAFRLLPAVRDAGTCMAGDAVLAFEFATTPAELTAIFSPAGDSCRPAAIAAMDAINTLDVAAYIPAYTAFGLCAALFLSGGRLTGLTLAAIGAAVLALVADYVETFTLLAITPGLETEAARLPVSSLAAWSKFAALALHAALLAVMALRDAPRRWIIGLLLLAPAIGVTAGFIDRERIGLLTLGFVAAWVPLMALAIWRAIRPKTGTT